MTLINIKEKRGKKKKTNNGFNHFVFISYWTRGLFFEKNADKIGL